MKPSTCPCAGLVARLTSPAASPPRLFHRFSSHIARHRFDCTPFHAASAVLRTDSCELKNVRTGARYSRLGG